MIITNNAQNPDMYLGSSKVRKIYMGDTAIYEEQTPSHDYSQD